MQSSDPWHCSGQGKCDDRNCHEASQPRETRQVFAGDIGISFVLASVRLITSFNAGRPDSPPPAKSSPGIAAHPASPHTAALPRYLPGLN